MQGLYWKFCNRLITAGDERELTECIGLLDKIIALQSTLVRGEPYGLRADMFFIHAQINRDKSSLDKAERDYRKALEVGAKDVSNHPIWREGIDNVRKVRSLI